MRSVAHKALLKSTKVTSEILAFYMSSLQIAVQIYNMHLDHLVLSSNIFLLLLL